MGQFNRLFDEDVKRHVPPQELTPWYPPEIKPAHPGVYETKSPIFDEEEGWYAFWDGEKWGSAYSILADDPIKLATEGVGIKAANQDRYWRGLKRYSNA